MGGVLMSGAVPGHEGNGAAFQPPHRQGRGRFPVRGVDFDLVDGVEQRVEARPAEYPDLGGGAQAVSFAGFFGGDFAAASLLPSFPRGEGFSVLFDPDSDTVSELDPVEEVVLGLERLSVE